MRTCAQCNVQYPDALEFCPRDGARLPGETRAFYDPLIGSTIDGRYIVEALLGQGGMGSVYAARHAIIDKRVAIKVLRGDVAGDDTAAARFLAEAKAASKIGHQNIVDITDFGVLPTGAAYFVMEFLDGPTLGKAVHESEHLQPSRAIGITVQIARGLQAAHDKGIIHRDLKPENIFVLERDGQSDVVKIVDFGIAKDQTSKKRLTQVGMVLGTPEYMSPEQATGQATDHRVDMYALGCMLYEMLTGDVPFRSDSATKTLTMHVFTAPEPPSKRRPDLTIPPALEAIVMRTIQKKPGDRFVDLREMMNALDRVDGELRGARDNSNPAILAAMPSGPIVVRNVHPSTQSQPMALPRKNRTGLIIAGSAGLGLVIFGGALALTQGKKPPPPPIAAAATPKIDSAPDKPTPPPGPKAAATVELLFRSRPPGAEVWSEGQRMGVTPLSVRRDLSEAPMHVVFRQPNFRDEARSVVPNGDKELEVVLARSATKVATSKHTPGATSPIAPQKTTPSGATKSRVSDLRNPFE